MLEVIIRIESKDDSSAKCMMKTVKWSVFFINATAFTMMVLVAIFFVKALDSTYSCYELTSENYCEEIFYDFM